jgi:hypothetical protein
MAKPKRGGRVAAAGASEKVQPTLSPESMKCLELLVKLGTYGRTKTQVAAYLITRELDELTRAGVLPRPPLGD